MLFLNFSTGPFDSFKSAYYAAVEEFHNKEIKFLIGDLEASQGAFQVWFSLPLLHDALSFYNETIYANSQTVEMTVLWSERGAGTPYPHSGN